MHLRIVKFESGGQQLPLIKKKHSENSFNYEKSSFLLKVLKTCFYPNHRMLNSYTFALSKIKSTSLDSTINKRKSPCIPYTTRKNNIFIKKSQKYRFLDLKYTNLNRLAFESRNIKMINLEVTKKVK